MCKEAEELDTLLSNQNELVELSLRSHSPPTSVGRTRTMYHQTGGFGSDAIDIFPQEATGIPPARTPFMVDEQASGIGSLSLSPIWTSDQDARRRPREPQSDIQSSVPTRKQCDMLLESYIRNYHPLVPLIHISSFVEQYNDCWTKQNLADDKSFLAFMLAICFAGAITCPKEALACSFASENKEDIAAGLRHTAKKALHASGFPHTPTLATLTAYIICQATCMRDEEPLSCVAFVGLALRVAQALGLHKDPSHFRSLSLTNRETRRRVWWHIVHIDVLIATASGLPPLVDTASWDVRPLSELKDEYIGTIEGSLYEEGLSKGLQPLAHTDQPDTSIPKSLVSPGGILVEGKLRTSSLMRQFLAKLCHNSPPSQMVAVELRLMLKDLTQDLQSRIERIEIASVTTGSDRDHHVERSHAARLHSWARLLLSTFADGLWTFTCHPLLSRHLTDVWPTIFDEALLHCRSMLFKVAYLACNPDFDIFSWSWPGNHQPLHAVAVILHSLEDRPDGSGSRESQDAIDMIFALRDPSHGLVAGTEYPRMKRPLVAGGTEAWSHLARLRTKAWRAAGLNPDVFWTRQEAVEFCMSMFSNSSTEARAGETGLRSLNREEDAHLNQPEIMIDTQDVMPLFDNYDLSILW
ncbi:hypothetical protein EV356DRAFT_504934 [Viridothelium virens]|uniref:Xylanolytic transcriptional activator regulatory domain-containing protein n=1 Tax=Viridothelium virens TaxID=1048519 RepID=A0A6A6H3V0_VIRVR|nr:hypothetical protein EV356DRAFT_504934 [Viridothelium virens]